MKSAYAVMGIVLAVMVFAMGCTAFIPDITGAPKTTPTKAPTKAPTKVPTQNLSANRTVSPTINVAATVFVKETTLRVIVPTKTPTPTPSGYYLIPPEPTGIPTVVETVVAVNTTTAYARYQDGDFKIEYPSEWMVMKSSDPAPNGILYGNDKFQLDSRIVIFESGDGKTNFTAQISDLRVQGYYDIKTGIDWVHSTVNPRFSDVAGNVNSVTNYEKKETVKKTQYVQFDVILPEGSAFYPHAYTEQDRASWSHLYIFRFNTAGDLDTYKEIKNHMFDTLVTEERIKTADSEF